MVDFVNDLDEEIMFETSTLERNIVPLDNSLLLEIEVPYLWDGSEYLVEMQALNGIERWSDNFSRITVCAYAVDRSQADESMVWQSPKMLLKARNIELVVLPNGFHPKDFFKYRKSVERTLTTLIHRHQYLCFSSIGGMGKWGNIGVNISIAHARAYSVWFDWAVETMPIPEGVSFKRKLKCLLDKIYEKRNVKRAIAHADLGLFHGKSVYDHYKAQCLIPQLVHDIHIGSDDVISKHALKSKLYNISAKPTLNIGYVGRLHPMKAPKDWVEIIEKVAYKLGRDNVHATWVGTGPMLDEIRTLVKAKKLEDVITLKGFIADKEKILTFLRSIDVFVFCHVTQESPRSLIESIISATPIVGYDSAYARDLVGDRGGALLSPVSNTDAVVAHLCGLAENKTTLKALTEAVAQSRTLYNDEVVFKHRSDLIKRYLKAKTALVTF